MGEEGRGRPIDRVAADRQDDRDAASMKGLAEVGRRLDPVAQVVVRDGLLDALGDGLEVAPGEPAVGGKALGQDQHVAARLGEGVVVAGEPPADVGERVLLGTHRHPVGERGHLPHDVGDVATGLALLALADEPGVLCEAAGVEEQGQAVAVANGRAARAGWRG